MTEAFTQRTQKFTKSPYQMKLCPGAIMTTAKCQKPLKVGEDNSKFEPKRLRKIQVYQYGRTRGVLGMLSPYLASVLRLLSSLIGF